MGVHPRGSNTSSRDGSPLHRSSSANTPSGQPKAKKARRSKVAEACKFCRRSHMSCDAARPCSRCVKRDIAHLCIAEGLQLQAQAEAQAQAQAQQSSQAGGSPLPLLQHSHPHFHDDSSPLRATSASPAPAPTPSHDNLGPLPSLPNPTPSPQFTRVIPPNPFPTSSMAPTSPLVNFGPQSTLSGFPPLLNNNLNLAMLDLASDREGIGAGLDLDMSAENGDFQGLGLSEFLQSLNDSPFALSEPLAPTPNSTQQQSQPMSQPIPQLDLDGLPTNTKIGLEDEPNGAGTEPRSNNRSAGLSVPGSPINKTERFLLTAADQKDGSRSDRLARVIHAKFEAGLLRPYNHVAGYTRLMRWMADNMSQSSRQRTLQTLSEFRPAFRAIASGLTDLDLVFIEEAFERLLLDYDRVFSSMGIPSCLWRRTGEIYKGNKEFAALVGVPIEHLQGGKLAIYELMAEESAVNYWEKYGNIAFDAGQKAVLTSCVLVNQSILKRKKKKAGVDKAKLKKDALISCCFSFTIRRDSYAIPSAIVGNFLLQ